MFKVEWAVSPENRQKFIDMDGLIVTGINGMTSDGVSIFVSEIEADSPLEALAELQSSFIVDPGPFRILSICRMPSNWTLNQEAQKEVALLECFFEYCHSVSRAPRSETSLGF